MKKPTGIPARKRAEEAPPITLPPIVCKPLTYPNTREGAMHFRFQDTCTTVSEDGRKLGSIECGIGATVDLCDEATGVTFTLHPRQLWEAFQVAIKQHPEYEALKALARGKA